MVCALDVTSTQLGIAGRIAIPLAAKAQANPEIANLLDGQVVADSSDKRRKSAGSYSDRELERENASRDFHPNRHVPLVSEAVRIKTAQDGRPQRMIAAIPLHSARRGGML